MKRIINKQLITIAATLLAGLVLGYIIKSFTSSDEEHQHETENVGAAEQIWTCSMHPQIRQNETGDCPICGMELIPLVTSDIRNDADIHMSAMAMKLANIQTATIHYQKAVKELRMNGKVKVDERKVSMQSSHAAGRIEKLFVNFTGEQVKKGQQLATIYAPELATAQEELLQAYQVKDEQEALYIAARRKLKNWKLSENQIDKIISTSTVQEQLSIFSDVSGIVLKRNVSLGDYVGKGQPLFEIVDLSSVWVLLDVYEQDLPWVKKGKEVFFGVRSEQGTQFSGKVVFVDPVINPATRVAQARIEVSNPKGVLKPEMFVEAVLSSTLDDKEEVLIVPKSAVMWTGQRSLVYVKNENNNQISFQAREVTLGTLTDSGYLIESGIKRGEEIAINGTFSIDAAAQLGGNESMMNKLHKPSQENKELPILLKQYIELKNALVKSDLLLASRKGQMLQETLENFEEYSTSNSTNESYEKIITSSRQLSSAKNLHEARVLFKEISDAIILVATTFDSSGYSIYVQHCPMAFNGEGADWVDTDRSIENPYFGDEMINCGSVVEELEI